VLKLANATAERGLLEQQDFRRSPKAPVIGGRYSISKMLQIDGRCSTPKRRISRFGDLIHSLRRSSNKHRENKILTRAIVVIQLWRLYVRAFYLSFHNSVTGDKILSP
jgi:hypothetical protein